MFFGNVHKTFHVLAWEKDCLVIMAEEVGRWKLGLIILEEEERKLEIVEAMVEEVVPYLEEVEGEVRGVENKSSMGSMLISKSEECLVVGLDLVEEKSKVVV
uniref:Uncharacterized protein n=1 Tax=Tanacetum cinerariifolium TaxID=118510 RepID=A0A6L2NL21_TANCI|nr:hypothetical protein [Tanacetum cinerariifolium]